MRSVLATVLQWVLAAFLGIFAAMFFPSASSLIFAAAAVLCVPIKSMRKLLDAVFKKGWLKGVAIAMLFVLGMALTLPSVKTQSGSSSSASKEVVWKDEGTTRAAEDVQAVNKAELVQKTKVLEYSNKPIDVMELVSCSDKTVSIKPVGDIALGKLGSQTAVFELARGDATRSAELVFEVKDTHAPEIKTKEDQVNVAYGAKYDPADNVASVADPVDGDAKRLRKEPKSSDGAWYVVKGEVNTKKAGEYPVSVVACDANGNRKTKDFKVVVEPAPAPAHAPEPAPAPEGESESSQPESPGSASDAGGAQNPFPDQGLPPATTAYVLNHNTKKFHRPSCRYVKKIAEHNREDVDDTRENIIAEGYKPCKVCKP